MTGQTTCACKAQSGSEAYNRRTVDFRFFGYPANLSCTVEYFLFHSKSLNYGLLQENTFHYPWIIFGHNGIKRQQMRDLLFTIARASANVLWASLLYRMQVCIKIMNSEFLSCQRNQFQFNFYVTGYDTVNDVAFFHEGFAQPTDNFCRFYATKRIFRSAIPTIPATVDTGDTEYLTTVWCIFLSVILFHLA